MNTELVQFQNANEEHVRGIVLHNEDVSSHGVLFVSGFERSATTEPKFKDLADRLGKEGVPSMRFDFSGLGLSDGDFQDTTLDKLTDEFHKACIFFCTKTGVQDIFVVGHSLGCCVIAQYITLFPKSIPKAVLIAPALDQKNLMRYWFVSEKSKKDGFDQGVEWGNYRAFLNEEEFQKDINRTDRLSKYNAIGAEYFQACSQIDFSEAFVGYEGVYLHIHGDTDMVVPMESVGTVFSHMITVRGGGHDMERPDQRIQWINQAVEYLVG